MSIAKYNLRFNMLNWYIIPFYSEFFFCIISIKIFYYYILVCFISMETNAGENLKSYFKVKCFTWL